LDLRLEPIARLGAGASSTVDLARLGAAWGELAAGTEVAIKRLRPELRADPAACTAFAAEAEHGALVRHPSLVRVFGAAEDADGPLLVLSYVAGPSLADRLVREGAIPEQQVRRIGAELAGALAALHAAGIVHGDLKPENVRLDAEGRAVLLDLGLARAVSDGRTGGGSILYLSPERAQGGAPSKAADVFALGVVLFELATGVHPLDPRADEIRTGPLRRTSGRLLPRAIEEEGADAYLARVATARVPAPSVLVPELSPFLDAAILSTLARAPELRAHPATLAEAFAGGESGTWWRARVHAGDPPEHAPRSVTVTGDRIELPLVGREGDLRVLHALYDDMLHAGRGALAWLVGPEGSGKWRVAREFTAHARLLREPPVYLYARWTEVTESRPAGALSLLLHRWLQLPAGRAFGARERERLEQLVAPADALVLEAAMAPDADEHLYGSPGVSSGVTVGGSVGRALAEWLVALSATRPVVVFLDELHRAGEVTLGALTDVVRSLARMHVLLILGMRDETSPQNPGARAALGALVASLGSGGVPVGRIDLKPLSQEDAVELVRRVFHRSVPRLRLAEVLWQRSRGNPGMIAEILNALIARGEVSTSPEGGLLLAIGPDDLPMPKSLGMLIAERLRGVPAERRKWLERLAVVGGRIEPEFVRVAFPPTSAAEVDVLLAGLVRDGWLVAAAERYRFARPALREAVYRTMPAKRRVRLHAAAARGLAILDAAAHPTDSKASPEALFQRAFHLRAADEHAAALELVLELIGRVRGRAASQRLLVLARWGLEALDRLPARAGRDQERLLLLEVAADAADRLGARDEERELLDRLVDLDVDSEADPASATRLYLLHGRYAMGTGQLGLARGFLRNAREISLRVADDAHGALKSEAARRLGAVQAQIGDLVDARALAQEALEITDLPLLRSLAHLGLALVDALEDRFEDGLERVGFALAELRDQRVPALGVLGFASLMRARLLRSAGRPGRAIGAARRAVRLAERAGERRFEAEARARLGALLFDLNHTEEAEAQLRDALLRSREIEDRRGAVIAETWLGILLWEADDGVDTGARDVVERAAHGAQEMGFYRAEAVALAILARIRRAAGELDLALRASERAAHLVHQYGAELADRIVVLGTHALVLTKAGRAGEARLLVRELRRRMRLDNARIRSDALRRGQRAYATQLLELVLSPDGPVYPRAG
jgi:tetratricopeptide (TPR) repeat protein